MGILSSIKEKILGKAAGETAKSTTVTAAASAPAGAAAAAAAEAAGKAALAAAAAKAADVEAILEAAVKAKGIKLNWRVSIVDLMKALDLDSSLAARKELAEELKYTGTDPDGSAEKNTWLHKELMKTLAKEGGKIPKELLG
jgi:3-oxoacyl-ACP reductase-like protein